MFNFCPHCAKPIGQEQTPGKQVVCRHCGKPIGTAAGQVAVQGGVVVTHRPPVDQNEELIQKGVAARCPECSQVVELKGTPKAFVPHFQKQVRKMCRMSGKPLERRA
jgi:DNA-directed RNA polymerase subunit RPC12/RpoP